MILRYLGRREWVAICFCLLFVFLQCYFDLAIPGYMSSITMTLQSGGGTDAIMPDGISMVVCTACSLVFSLAGSLVSSWVASSLVTTLRRRQFERVSEFSMEELNHFSSSSLINRFTNDIVQIQRMMVMGLNALTKTPMMATIAILKISGGSWQWTAITVISVIMMCIVILVVMRYVIPRFKRIQALTDDVNRVTEENITGIRVVRAYNAGGYQEARSDAANMALTDNNLSAQHAMSVMNPFVDVTMNMLSMSIYWIGALLITSAVGEARLEIFSDMVVFSTYTMHVVLSFMFMIMTLMQMPRMLVSSKRVQEVIDTEPTIISGTSRPSREGTGGTVEFRDVSFRYPGSPEDVVSHVSFTANPGDVVAIIGATGSGKSSLMNLIPRFYDVTSGQVLVDGVDVREYDLEDLRSRLGYVPQNTTMFTGTVGFNVGYGMPDDGDRDAKVRRALDIAQATQFVESMDMGVDAMVSQGGKNLSGGQRQRLAIARAVCRDPRVLLLDDSFSALDFNTDLRLRRALDEHCSSITRIVVAQRVGTIMDADRIIVLEDGCMVGTGTHEELMASCDVYREIAMSQLNEGEVP